MKVPSILLPGAALLVSILPGPLLAQNTIRKELPTAHAHASVEALRPALEKALSPQGRFVLLPNKGTILVIDTPEGVENVARALRNLAPTAPRVALDFAFRGGIPQASTFSANQSAGVSPFDDHPRRSAGFPVPIDWAPPRIIPSGTGYIVIPATPTKFATRDLGFSMTTRPTANPDGTVSLDIDMSNTELAGFVNYGSDIFAPGAAGVIPVSGQVANPGFFTPFIVPNKIVMPIFSTTRIRTRVLVKPEVKQNYIAVDMVPQLDITNPPEPGVEEHKIISLNQFRTSVVVPNRQSARVAGFQGAPPEFNRQFFGAGEDDEGGTSITVKARILTADEAGSPADSGIAELKEEAKPEKKPQPAGTPQP